MSALSVSLLRSPHTLSFASLPGYLCASASLLTPDDRVHRRGSPNIEMDEHTFLTNRERAVDYLNSLDKVFVNDQFLNWDPENRIKVRIISARAYHSLFMHNM